MLINCSYAKGPQIMNFPKMLTSEALNNTTDISDRGITKVISCGEVQSNFNSNVRDCKALQGVSID